MKIVFIGKEGSSFGIRDIIIKKINITLCDEESFSMYIKDAEKYFLKEFNFILRKEKIFNILNERTK